MLSLVAARCATRKSYRESSPTGNIAGRASLIRLVYDADSGQNYPLVRRVAGLFVSCVALFLLL